MDLQSIFYFIAIVSLLLWLAFLGFIAVSLHLIFRRTRDIQATIVQKLDQPSAHLLGLVLPILALILPLLGKIRRSRS